MKPSIFSNSALHIVKGAVCTAFGLSCGRTTKSVRYKEILKACLTVGPIASSPTEEQRHLLQCLINEKVSDDVRFRAFSVPKIVAEKLYGEEFYDDFGIPTSVQTVRLVTLEEWNINASIYPVLKSTGLLGSIQISSLKFKETKNQVELEFIVCPNIDVKLEVPASWICQDEELDEADLPRKNKVIPGGSASFDGLDDESRGSSGQQITPWNVTATKEGIDYEMLLKEFGSKRITEDMINRFEQLLNGKKMHHLLRRMLFFSHRDLDLVMKDLENGKLFYVYTGRGPSSEVLHVGHLVPFLFTSFLQEAFDVPVIIQLTDDEKYLFKEDILTVEEVRNYGFENARHIIACGFKKDKTFIFRDTDYIGSMYPLILSIQKRVTFNQSRGIFGFNGNDNIGKIAFPAVQAAPSFAACFPVILKNFQESRCLIPQAIDQDPYFRMTRDVAPRLNMKKPALIHSQFFPALQGFSTKMSASSSSTAIFVNDTPKEIRSKILKHAFSGGQQTAAEQREKGANLEVDVPFQYLRYLLEDDELLANIKNRYQSGDMLTSEVKEILIEAVTQLLQEHQARVEQVTDEMIYSFMDPNRSLV